MSTVTVEPEPVPLVRDEAGRLMIEGTRVPLDVIVMSFKQGKSPEAIYASFDTVALADVYAVLACYLRHRAEVEAYLAEQERLGTETQARIEAEFPPEGLRAKLLARLDK